MEILNQTENKHFYYNGKGCLFNENLESCVAYIDSDSVDYLLNKEDSAKFYKSGAFLTYKNGNTISIRFIKNNAKCLFSIDKKELEEMENKIYDINALVCSSGVLVAYQYYDDKNSYEYYLYNGAMFIDNDFDSLKRKIDEYEEGLNLYHDYKDLNKKCTNNKNFIHNFINEETEL